MKLVLILAVIAQLSCNPVNDMDGECEDIGCFKQFFSRSKPKANIEEIQVLNGDIEALRDSIQGRIVLPSDEDYDLQRQCWNKDSAGTPSAIVMVKDDNDVVEVVRFAAANKLKLGVASGRHSALCMVSNAIVIDFSQMKRIQFNEDKSEVTIQSGVKMGDIDSACKPHGVAIVGGTNPDTGCAGLTLGGGVGYLARQHGLAIDNLLRVKMVLNNGEIIVADNDNYSDLFFGIRGAGANFGVVLEFTFKTHVVPKSVALGTFVYLPIPLLAGNLFEHPLSALKKAVAYSETNLENEIANIMALPCKGPAVCMFANFKADSSSKSDLVQIQKMCGYTPIKPIKMVNYHDELQSVLLSTQKTGYYYEKGALFGDLSEELLNIFYEYTHTYAPNSKSAIVFFRLGGKIQDMDVDSTAFANRHAQWWVIILGKWDRSHERSKVVQWARDVFDATKSFQIGQYAPVVGAKSTVEEFVGGTGMDAFGNHKKHLQALKKKYDPENLFQLNRNIRVD